MKRNFSYLINLDDIDFMGVVGHGNWLLILQRARVQLLEALGWSYEKMREERVAATVRSVQAEYLLPVLHRETVVVEIETAEISKTSMLLRHSCTSQGRLVVKCDLRIVFINEQGRPVRIPETVISAINAAGASCSANFQS